MEQNVGFMSRVTEENIAEAKLISDKVWLSAHFDQNDKRTIQFHSTMELMFHTGQLIQSKMQKWSMTWV